MTKTLTTERQKFEEYFNVFYGCHPTDHHDPIHVEWIWHAWQDGNTRAVTREAHPVYQCRFFTTDFDGKQIGEWQDMDKGFYDQYDPHCRRVLYTAPPAPAVPDGFKLMPIEMTDEIGEAIAMEGRCCGGIALCIYEAALAAAPEGGNG